MPSLPMWAKGLIAALIALLSGLATGAQDNALTLAEWLTAAAGAFAAFGAMYGIGTKVPPPSYTDRHAPNPTPTDQP